MRRLTQFPIFSYLFIVNHFCLGIKANPVAKSAVFWYNLLRDGRGDGRTKHAACPVLMGEKTVSNIWFHERGEEFTRKCLLEINALSTLAP
jgi:prolyl 4-hydroxylase